MPLQHSSQGVIKASPDRILHSGCQASFSWSLFDLIFACVILLLFPRPQLTRLSRPLSPSRWYLLFHPCVCHPQTLSLSIWFFSPRSLMIAQRQHPRSAESRGGSSSWKGLMVIQTISLMGMGIICFLMSPSDSLWKKMLACPCLFGVGPCFVSHWRPLHCSMNILYVLQGPLQKKMNLVSLKTGESLCFISCLHANPKTSQITACCIPLTIFFSQHLHNSVKYQMWSFFPLFSLSFFLPHFVHVVFLPHASFMCCCSEEHGNNMKGFVPISWQAVLNQDDNESYSGLMMWGEALLLLKPREVVPLTLHCQGFTLRIELKLNLGVETWEMAFRIISECPESLLSANRQGKDVLGASSVFQCTVSSFQCFVL